MNVTMITCAGCVKLAALLSLLCVTLTVGAEDLPEVRSAVGADSVLQCTAESKPGVQYRAVRWYKVRDPSTPSRLSGILSKDLPDGVTRWYTSVEREVELREDSHSIFLPNVTCDDGGEYVCSLAANVGEQNREGRVLLTLPDCSDGPTEYLMTDAFMVTVATAVLMFALVIFLISYVSLKNMIRDRNKKIIKETLLDAPLKPLDKKDLMLIYTLGPKTTPTMKHFCV